MSEIETDYLIVGAGAAGMAFADEVVSHSDADVVMVDRRHSPGGHWNDAYPFVRLHQPSAFYGVNSRPLGTDSIDNTGPNAGFYERASGVEICGYYQKVSDEQLLASGRVRFFGMSDYVGDWSSEHAFTSRLTRKTHAVRARRRIVDGTYLQTSVPAIHAPEFEVDPDARLIAVGDLVDLAEPADGYTILGAGKTAMDACNWLLDGGVDPEMIRWVKPRDAWVLDRSTFQPLDLLVLTVEAFSLATEAIAQAEDAEDLFPRLEACGELVRIDPTVEPTMFRGAILSQAEREDLQKIERVVRNGRVLHLGADRIVLENGEIPTNRGEVHVDCTAYGLPIVPTRPIFEPGRVTLQSLMGGQTTPAAALVAFVELTRDDDAEKNRLCSPIPNPSRPIDFVHSIQAALHGLMTNAVEPDLMDWSQRSRLSLTRGLNDQMGDPRMQTAMNRLFANLEAALKNADDLLAAPTSVN